MNLKRVGKSISGVFDKTLAGADRLFNKGSIGGTKLFGKGSEGSKALGATSHGLADFANMTRQAGKAVGKFINDERTQAALAATPFGGAVNTGARALAAGLGGVSSASRLGSGLTKQRNYNGDASEVATNILERTKATGDAVKGIKFV